MATNASFLPEDYLQKRLQMRTNVVCLSLFGIVMVAVGVVYIFIQRQAAYDRRLGQEIDQRFIEADHRLQQLDEMKARHEQMIRKAAVTSKLLERVPRTLILSELINSMPKPVCLLEMGLSTRVLPNRPAASTALEKAKLERMSTLISDVPVDVPPTEVTLDLVGVAPTDVQVAQFMTTLGKSPIFMEPTLSYSEDMVVENQHLRKFEVSLTINQDIDVSTIAPKMVKRDGGKLDPMGGVVRMDKDGRLVLPAEHNVAEPARVLPASNR